MTNNDSKPIGKPVLIGRSGFQIYSRIWNERVQFYARVGKPYVKKETGEAGVVAIMEDSSSDDFLRAATEAKAQLDQIRNAHFQQMVESQKVAVSRVGLELVSDANVETVADEPAA